MSLAARLRSGRLLALASLLILSGLALLLVVLPSSGASAEQKIDRQPSVAAPLTPPMTWQPSRRDGFGQTSPAVLALADFKGWLYAGVSSDSPAPVLVWAYDQEAGWGISSSPGFGGRNTGVHSLAVFNDVLYAATSNANGAQVWSSGGTGWSHVADRGFGDPGNDSIPALAAFNGRLFAGTRNAGGAQMWAYDGQQWTRAVPPGLMSPDSIAVESLAVHNDRLYAATRNAQGAQVWSTADGNHWNLVMGDGFGQATNVAVVALASYQDRLYAAVENSLGHGGEIWYLDWNGWHLSAGNGFASSSQPADANNVGITSLAVHSDILWAGTLNDVYGTQIWFNDGSEWWPSTKTGLGVGQANRATRAMASYAEALWIGIENGTQGAEAWYGKPELGLAVVSRDRAVTPPNSLHYDVEIVNTLGITLTGLQAFETWESSGDCVYDALGRTYVRWDIGEVGPGESRAHRFSLLTHSWCLPQLVTNTVRLQGDNLAPMFAFANTVILEVPTPTTRPSPSPTARNPVIVTLQQGQGGYSGASSTYLSQNNPTRNYCQEPGIRVGAHQQLAGILRFGLESIPSNADVVSATLHLYGLDRAQGRDIPVGLFAISRTVEACQASWNQSHSGEPWGIGGCKDVQTDRRPDPEVSFTTSGTRHWYALDVTAAVREWAGGSQPNNGFLLLGPLDNSEVHSFASVGNVEQTLRPQLSVAYFPSPAPTETPTPTAMNTPTPTPTHTETTTPVCPDAYEPNDGLSAAWDIGWGGHIESYLCSAQDIDDYVADIGTQPFNALSITLSNLPADYNLRVYDVAQRLIASSTQPGLASEDIVVGERLAYIEVYGADGAHDPAQPYHLDVIPISLATVTPTATMRPTITPTATARSTLTPTATVVPTMTTTATIGPTMTPTATVGPTLTLTATTGPTPTTVMRWHLYLPIVMASQTNR